MIKFHWYHKNLKCWGLTVGSFYADLSFPPVEGWGFSWGTLTRVYWKRNGVRHYLSLPSCKIIRRY